MKGRAAVLGLAGLLVFGCATPNPSSELPDSPIAFVHRTLAQGRERADQLKSQRGEKVASGEGVMKLNELDSMVDRVRGARSLPSPAIQGRLALYDPRLETVDTIAAFVPGALPFDWSEDRTRLMVASGQHGAPRLFEYSLARRDVGVPVSARPTQMQIGGSYGPDGAIVYAEADRTDRGVLMSVWVSEAGAEPRRLTPGPYDQAPRWSPDGKVVLFASRLRNGNPVIKAIDPWDPLAQPQVIARGREARFSPRGDWVVYSRERGGGWRLWRMRPDGTGKTALGHATQGQADERHPTVSPDGRYVAYVAEHDDRQQIRIRAMDGSGDRLLIEQADGTLPVW